MRKNRAGFAVVIATALCGLLVGASSASAAASQRLDLEINNAWIFQQQGGSFVGFPATGPVNGSLEMSGDLDSGSFSFPKEQFQLNPSLPGVFTGSTLQFGASDDLTGSYDAATGQMSVSIPVNFTTTIANPFPEPDQPASTSCEINGFTAELNTRGSIVANGGASTFSGQPFVSGKSGALLGGWSMPTSALVDHVHGVNGTPDAVCQEQAGGSPDGQFAGQFWIKGNATVTDLVCPVNQIGTPPDCRDAPATIALRPAKRTVKAGKTTSFKLQVQNKADSDQKTKVTFKSSNRRVKIQKAVTVTVPARGVVITDVKVKVARNAKGKALITATAAGGKSSVKVIVKKAKKKLKKPKKR